MKRWDEGTDCKVCEDRGTFKMVLCGEELKGFCDCEAGDEAHERDSLVRDGWAA